MEARDLDPTSNAADDKGVIWVLDEHLDFAHDLGALQAAILSRDRHDLKKLRGDVTWWLRSAIPRLTAHQRREEGSHMYRALPVEHPSFAPTLERLRSEHRVIDAQARELLALVHSESVTVLLGRLATLIRLLKRHQADEDDVLLEAYFAEPQDP